MTGSSVRVVGGLVPPDVVSAVLAGSMDGLGSADYHLGGEAPKAAAARVWTHLSGVYRRFRDDLAKLPKGDAAVGPTRERWLNVLLTELGYGRVPTTPAGGLTVDGKSFPVSHVWDATPMHLLGWGVDLDTRSPGVPGAAQRAPHAMVQELLNRTDDYLWAIVSNGRVLRLLRDSTTLTGQAYVEFDLESIFDAEVFSDFVTLFLLCHQSRVEVPEGGRPADCWLERWRTTAVSQGVRALNLLRAGVKEALETLGTGFLQHPANAQLRGDLESGRVRLAEVHQNLLRIVYRILFWSVAEDRDALLSADAMTEQRQRYADHFSSIRLRKIAVRRHGTAQDDLWQAVTLVMTALAQTNGEPRLGLPGLGGLFSTNAADVLTGCRLGNQPLLSAVRSLSIVQPKGQPRRHVDFRNLGAEELGSIYESLLELVPRHDPTTHLLTLQVLAGNDRKTTGSYYTPTSLVELVLDTALDPVLDAAEKNAGEQGLTPERSLLALRVCDPAIGSGHFMVAAARRIATRLAVVRTGEIDPTPTTISDAMHDVVARCIYGVDLNPMAADLAKVSLWLEAMTPGKPLSFLDHHIKVGNALLGTTPALLAAGIPDDAYKPLTGDDKPTAVSWRKINANERAGQDDLFGGDTLTFRNTGQQAALAEIAARAETASTLADIAWAEQRYDQAQHDPRAVRDRQIADAWCTAFLAPKTIGASAITQGTLTRVANNTASTAETALVQQIAGRHRLFHWHLEFPDIFTVPDEAVNTPSGWTGGFHATLGNPLWETLQISEKEFFATRAPEIADAPNAAARKRAIAALEATTPALWVEFADESRRTEAENQLIRGGRFPLCATGKINTYSVFAEHFRTSLAPTGRSGIITPTGLATDATTAAFFADTLKSSRLAAFYDFENEAKIFDGVHNQFRFAVTSMSGGEVIREVRLAFYTRYVEDVPARRFALAAEEVLLLNPNTGTLPVFRTRRDAEITLACYRRHPVLIREGQPRVNAWGLRFSQGLFNMASDSGEFRTADDLAALAPNAVFDGLGLRGWRPPVVAPVRGQDAQPLEPSLCHLQGRHSGPTEQGHAASARRGLPRFAVH